MKNHEKVFVTGADGMLGASICRELIHQNYQVKGLVLPGRNLPVLKGVEMEIVQGNILDRSALKKYMKGCSYIIHCAALTTVWPRRLEAVRKVNFEAIKVLIEVSKSLGIKRLVYIGSASSFGYGPKNNPGDENTKFNGWKYGMDYIESKYQAQNLLLKEYRVNHFPVVIINPTFMIGPYDSAPSSGKMVIELLLGKVPAYAGGGKNFVYSKDVAVAAVNAIEYGKLGECYIAGNDNLEYGEFFQKVCEVFEVKFRLWRIPSFFILIVGFIYSVQARITGTPPKISYTMAKMASVHQYYSVAKAIKELKIPQTPIEVAIRDCCEWFVSNGYLTKSHVAK